MPDYRNCSTEHEYTIFIPADFIVANKNEISHAQTESITHRQKNWMGKTRCVCVCAWVCERKNTHNKSEREKKRHETKPLFSVRFAMSQETMCGYFVCGKHLSAPKWYRCDEIHSSHIHIHAHTHSLSLFVSFSVKVYTGTSGTVDKPTEMAGAKRSRVEKMLEKNETMKKKKWPRDREISVCFHIYSPVLAFHDVMCESAQKFTIERERKKLLALL